MIETTSRTTVAPALFSAALEPLELAFNMSKLAVKAHESCLGLLEDPAFDGRDPVAQQAGLCL